MARARLPFGLSLPSDSDIQKANGRYSAWESKTPWAWVVRLGADDAGAEMDSYQLSPYPHYSWFAYWLAICPPRVLDVFECRSVTHRVVLTTSGDADLVWKTGTSEIAFHATVGDISFFPRDDASHIMSITAANGYRAYCICIPEDHVRLLWQAESILLRQDPPAVPLFHDTLLHASLLRLSSRAGGRRVSEEFGDEVAARHIVTRLCALAGAPQPEWHRDASVFRTLTAHRHDPAGIPTLRSDLPVPWTPTP